MSELILTKEQRNVIYRRALELHHQHSSKGEYFGMCMMIEDAVQDEFPKLWDDHELYPFEHMDQYPKILKHKPEDVHAYWFPKKSEEGIQKRFSIFAHAIEETL
jgi:hypothetical protein